MDTWTFIWLVVVLKIPIVALFLIVRWAVRQEPTSSEDDGGIGPRSIPRHPHHPRSRPPRPRRGPHGDPATPPPPRVRTIAARRRLAHN